MAENALRKRPRTDAGPSEVRPTKREFWHKDGNIISISEGAACNVRCTSPVSSNTQKMPPIFTLEDELFIAIFQHAVHFDQGILRDLEGADLNDVVQQTFRISHVCRLWRDLALRTSTLWKAVHSRHLDCITHFLDHAREQSIYMVFDATVPHLLTWFTNWSTLPTNVYYHSYMQLKALQLSLPHSFQGPLPLPPAIRTLSLRARHERGAPCLELPALEIQPLHIPPSLEDLSLEDVYFRSLLVKTNIETLCMASNGANWSSGPTIHEFTGILENCPMIEWLSLYHVGPVSDDGWDYPSRTQRQIALPHAKHLGLYADIDQTIAQILAHLIIPFDACITCTTPVPNRFQSILPRDEDKGGLLMLPHIQSVIYTHSGCLYSPKCFREYFLQGGTSGMDVLKAPSIEFDLDWDYLSTEEIRRQVMNDIKLLPYLSRSTRLPIMMIQDIHIHCNLPGVAFDDWRSILSGFVQVTSLCFKDVHILGDDNHDNLGDLNALLKALDHSPGWELQCSNLRKVSFIGIRMTQQFISFIAEVFTRRARQGASLDLLLVHESCEAEESDGSYEARESISLPTFLSEVVKSFRYNDCHAPCCYARRTIFQRIGLGLCCTRTGPDA